ncbi:NUDIX domain-containing protein [Candidatus Woesearchaeota archaeon]|nr:NUDIX domain-containing protein [Candidatus Woesearchaeota archaeon]
MQEGDATISVYDEQGDCIGEKIRGEVDKKQDILKSVHILLFNRKEELFVVRVAGHDSLYPKMIGCSAAGLVRSDETVEEAAIRTLQRELRLGINGELGIDGNQHGLQYHGEQFVSMNDVKRFMNVFSIVFDGDAGVVDLNPDDAEEGCWVSINKLDKKSCMPTLLEALRMLKQNRK